MGCSASVDNLTSYLDCCKFVLGNEEEVRFEEVVGEVYAAVVSQVLLAV